jgi:hypothetical protein
MHRSMQIGLMYLLYRKVSVAHRLASEDSEIQTSEHIPLKLAPQLNYERISPLTALKRFPVYIWLILIRDVCSIDLAALAGQLQFRR